MPIPTINLPIMDVLKMYIHVYELAYIHVYELAVFFC